MPRMALVVHHGREVVAVTVIEIIIKKIYMYQGADPT
jgi:hypothetical protein